MPRPYFVADQATVTVLKPVASSAFGSYKLSVPEDVDINDIYEFAAPGNELGYVASLAPKDVRVGGFARRFVRADVNVTAADTTDPDWVPASDVDKVLTEAAARVEGDFFLESDITKAGLGPWVPFTHFEQGDLATVEIWGRRVPLPVTRIEPKVTDHDENDWSVHVGGQVLTDDEARLAENETLRQAAVQSRREVAGLESQTAKAVSTAESANSKSDKALKAATDANGVIESKLADHRQLVAEFDADVVVNRQAADDMRRATDSYVSAVDAAKADTARYESLVDAAKADTARYESLVANSKAIQSAVESAAADARQASGEVSSLINAPNGEFRKGVAKFTEFQTMVNDKQSAWNRGIQKTLNAQADVNTKQQQINAVQSDVNTKQQQINEAQADVNNKQQQVNQSQQQVNQTQSNINRQQGEINTSLSKATTAATNAAADAVKASQSATTAVNAQKATVNDTNDLARLTHFRRTRVFIYERSSDSDSMKEGKLLWDDQTTALTLDADSSGATFKWDGAWEGYVKVTMMSATSRLGIYVFNILEFKAGKFELWDKVSSDWILRYVIEIFPLWPDKATKDRFLARGLTGLK